MRFFSVAACAFHTLFALLSFSFFHYVLQSYGSPWPESSEIDMGRNKPDKFGKKDVHGRSGHVQCMSLLHGMYVFVCVSVCESSFRRSGMIFNVFIYLFFRSLFFSSIPSTLLPFLPWFYGIIINHAGCCRRAMSNTHTDLGGNLPKIQGSEFERVNNRQQRTFRRALILGNVLCYILEFQCQLQVFGFAVR